MGTRHTDRAGRPIYTAAMNTDQVVRQQLVALLRGRQAHMPFEEAVADFPEAAINTKPPQVPYTPWHLLEHIRITQWDILEFIRNPRHVSPEWPSGYWPSQDATADRTAWRKTIEAILADRSALEDIVNDPATDLYASLPYGETYTIVREIVVVSDHTAYHTGEFAILRQVMGTWPAGRQG